MNSWAPAIPLVKKPKATWKWATDFITHGNRFFKKKDWGHTAWHPEYIQGCHVTTHAAF